MDGAAKVKAVADPRQAVCGPRSGCVQEERKTELQVTFPHSSVSPRGPSTEPDKDDGLKVKIIKLE